MHEELGVDFACGGKRTGAKVMGMRTKRFRVKMTFLKRPRQAGARVARPSAVSSLIYGSDETSLPPVQLNEAQLMPRKCCRETYHRCLDLDLMLEHARTDPGKRGATSVILVWHCAWVDRWVTAPWMTKTLVAASEKLSCINPWKLVNCLASAVVASRALSFASVGYGELHAVLKNAYDRWTWERPCNRLAALALVGGPPLTAPLKLVIQQLRTSGEHLARGQLQSAFLDTMRAQNLE